MWGIHGLRDSSSCYTGYLLTDRQSKPKVDSYEGRCIQGIDIERKNGDSPPLSGITVEISVSYTYVSISLVFPLKFQF